MPFRLGRPRSEVRGGGSEARGQRSEVRGQRWEVRGQKSKAGGQRSGIRGQKSKASGIAHSFSCGSKSKKISKTVLTVSTRWSKKGKKKNYILLTSQITKTNN